MSSEERVRKRGAPCGCAPWEVRKRRLEAKVAAHLQITRGGGRSADNREAVVIGGAVRSRNPAAASAGIAEGDGIGQIESLSHELELELSFLEHEVAGDALVEIEEAGPAQNVAAGGAKHAAWRIDERAAVVVRRVLIVAAEDGDGRVDLAGRVALAAGIHVGTGADGEGQTAEAAQLAAELPTAHDP